MGLVTVCFGSEVHAVIHGAFPMTTGTCCDLLMYNGLVPGPLEAPCRMQDADVPGVHI